jgi:CBS domain containing-hemolysin-like protein
VTLRLRSGTFAAIAAALPSAAQASFLSGDALDAAASFMAWVVIILVPVVLVALFLIVHVLPEKIAEKRHHPQQAAIKTLCFLSLAFGGMLWPLAWLWAYTRPVGFRAVYGTEKHENYFLEMAEKAERGELDAMQLEHLKEELAMMASRGALAEPLRGIPARLASARPKAAPAEAPAGGQA